MLKVVLAKDNLMCGFDDGIDPTNDQSLVRANKAGVRPNWFFGPRRDALSLLVRHMQTLLVLKPKHLYDLNTQLIVLNLPGVKHELIEQWREKSKNLLGQDQKVAWLDLDETESKLASDSDTFSHSFGLPVDKDKLSAFNQSVCEKLASLKLTASYYVDQNALRESWKIDGISSDDFEVWALHWHKPEIDASPMMQSTAWTEATQGMVSWRNESFFSVQAFSGSTPAALSYADCGWNQQGDHAADRIGDFLTACISEDKTLGFHYASQKGKKAWLGLNPKNLHALGETDALAAWKLESFDNFELRYRLSRSLDELASVTYLPFEEGKNQAIESDRSWIAKQKAAPSHLDEQTKDLYHRTLLTLRQMQDPEGGIIAAPEFHYALSHCGGYGFCWGRDAGFITLAMDVCGMHDESAQFYRYMARCQSSDGSFLHRHDMKGNLGSSWGFLQPDETGSVIFGLWKHLHMSGNKSLMTELKDMIVKGCEWLANAENKWNKELPISGFDLWEEREGVHVYAVAAMAAGLNAGIQIAESMGWDVPSNWQEKLSYYTNFVNSPLFIREQDGQTSFARTLQRRISAEQRCDLEAKGYNVETARNGHGQSLDFLSEDYVLDISLLGVRYPYETLDLNQHDKSYDNLVALIYKKLWRSGAGGIGRYEADHYRDGNPWILTTLWLALAASERSQTEIARTCWQWAKDHATPEGLLPEQIDPVSGRPAWVMPLTWSHAMFALAVHQLPKEVVS